MISLQSSSLNMLIQGYGFCHSIFDNVINLEFEKHPLVSIIKEGNSTQPYSYTLNRIDFEELKKSLHVNDRCYKDKNTLFFGGDVQIEESGIFDSSIETIEDISSVNITKMIDWLNEFLNNHAVRNDLFERVFENKNTNSRIDIGIHKLRNIEIEDNLINCIGHGVGLTPSSDDLCVGYFAVMYKLGIIEKSKLDLLVNWLVKYGDSYTNKISLKFLVCILQGYIEEDIDCCLNALIHSNYEEFMIKAKKLLDHGSSSGSDIMLGLLLALNSIQRSRNG